MIEDCDAYQKYKHHRKWFNKLWLAHKFNHVCGPAGSDIPKDDMYVVRPIYNLGGMGAGASLMQLKQDDYRSVPPGYFWCEYFNGTHYSVNYEWKTDHITGGEWKGTSCWVGVNMPLNLSKFVEWQRSSFIPEAPKELNELSDVKDINVEFIGDKVIEVHLRPSPDPEYDHIIPVWTSDVGPKKEHMEMHGYEFIDAYDDGNGYIDDPRVGFLVK